MTSIEVLATIFAILVLVKLAFIRSKPAAWMTMVRTLFLNPTLTMTVYVILALVVGYFLFSSMTIVQVGAVMLFVSLVSGIGLAPYSQLIVKMAQEIIDEGLSKAWLSMLLWTVISVWILCGVLIQII
ncbi:MAG: hypothetical protein GTO40_10030 [Deltaproteobacteria bacterium]|nr:hypothetical protein [Deltaproteobacteria bacterium]